MHQIWVCFDLVFPSNDLYFWYGSLHVSTVVFFQYRYLCRTSRTMSGPLQKNEWKRLLQYSLYGWGFPIIWVSMIGVFSITAVMPESLHPVIGNSKCYLENSETRKKKIVLQIVVLKLRSQVLLTNLKAKIEYLMIIKDFWTRKCNLWLNQNPKWYFSYTVAKKLSNEVPPNSSKLFNFERLERLLLEVAQPKLFHLMRLSFFMYTQE